MREQQEIPVRGIQEPDQRDLYQILNPIKKPLRIFLKDVQLPESMGERLQGGNKGNKAANHISPRGRGQW